MPSFWLIYNGQRDQGHNVWDRRTNVDQGAGICGRGRIAGAQTPINILEGFLFVLGGIFLHALDDDPFIRRGVHDFELVDSQFGDLFNDRFGEWFESAGHDEILLFVHCVFDQYFVGEIVAFLGFFDGEFFDFVEQLEDFLIRAVVLIAVFVFALAFMLEEAQSAERVVVKNLRRRFLRSR